MWSALKNIYFTLTSLTDVARESGGTLASTISTNALVEAAEGALVNVLTRMQSAGRRR